MVARPLLLMLLLWVASTQAVLAQSPDFHLSVTQTTIQLGKPVWLDIRTSKSSPSLDEIDFAVLRDQFEVIKDKNEIRQTATGQAWRIRLYPRQTGQLRITGLRFQTQPAPAIDIQVTTPQDSKTGRPFAIKHVISNTHVWLRQQVLITYELHSPEAQLNLGPQESTPANLLVIPLPARTQQQADGYRHTSGWAVYPRQPGAHTLQLPALHYARDGVVTHRFYTPAINLEVKPLPAYLPGNLPVGQLALQPTDLPGLVLKNNLADIQLQLIGEGIPLTWLPDIRHFFKSDAHLTIYPAEPRSEQTTGNGVQSSHRYRLPIKPTAQGALKLPDVKLHYFDPITGRLAQLSLPDRSVISLSLWLVVLLILIGVVVIAWSSAKVYTWLLPQWRCLKAYHAALKALPQMQTAQDYRQLIKRLSEAEGWSGNLTLRQWVEKLPAHTTHFGQYISQALEIALYRGDGGDVESIREWVKKACLRRWGLLKWV